MKFRKIVVYSILFFLIFGAIYLGYKTWHTLQTKDAVKVKTQDLPSISFLSLDGRMLNLDSFRKSKELLVLNYFNPDCDHCQNMVREMLQDQSRLDTVRWLMITSETVEKTKVFANSFNLSKLPTITVLNDTASLFRRTYGSETVPSFFVYRTGKLIRKKSGECSIEYLLQ